MRNTNAVMKSVWKAFAGAALLAAVYLIANACAGGGAYLTQGGLSGIVWVDSIPALAGRLHIHAHCTKPNAYVTDTLPMKEDSIPLAFSQWQSHSRINGNDYYGMYHSSFGTVHSTYAAGTWSIDSAYIDDGNGGAWKGKTLKVASLSVPTPTFEGDTLDFTR